jgi:predicted nucleotidyltransferase
METTDLPRVVRRYARELRALLKGKVVAVYLGGSFATGDFVPGASDYDLMVVMDDDLDAETVIRLRSYHEDLARSDADSLRLEGDYVPRAWITAEGATGPTWWFRDGRLHDPAPMLSADNIANLRTDGIALLGPKPGVLLPPVTPDQVRAAVREMLAEAPDVTSERSAAKELLDVARSLAALETGQPTSHAAGLRWALAKVDVKWHDALRHAAEVRAGGAVDANDHRLRRALEAWRGSLGLPSS